MPADRTRTWTVEQMARANADAGFHWFKADTLRFFGSRIHSTTYAGTDGLTYFVTSERTGFDSYERAFTVRVFDPATSSVDTFGDFLAYGTRAQAHAAARSAARS